MHPWTPTRIVSAEEMRTLDRAASEQYGVPSLLLMENAGREVAEVAHRRLAPGRRVVIVCGPGNNGGDGLVAARHLRAKGVPVEVLLLAETMKGDAALNLEAFRRQGGAIRPFRPEERLDAGPGDVVLDSIFGTGLSRPPEGRPLAAIEAINLARDRGALVIAVDLPSGLETDSGKPTGESVQADVTVTLGYVKRGLVIEPGCSIAGELCVADIGIPRQAESRLTHRPVFMLTEGGIRSMLPRRDASSHKGDFGHVLVIAGSPGKSGAAAMTCAAALRGGAGLVTLAARVDDILPAQRYMPEVMAHPLPGDGPLSLDDLDTLLQACRGKRVLAIGPGLYRGPETGALLLKLIEAAGLPVVIDADGLNALAEVGSEFGRPSAPVMLTPHPGEMARLLGSTSREVQDDRIGAARGYADAHGVTVVLKGARTVIADANGATAINTTGNPGMATAGSGDVLTGLCSALVAQGLTIGSAAAAAVFIHGLAGDRVVRRRGMMGLVATDLLDAITDIWAEWGL